MDPLIVSMVLIIITVVIALGAVILIWRSRTIEQEQQELNLQKDKYELFVQYHAQGLEQARACFYVSLLAAILGFVIIGISIYFTIVSGLKPGILTGAAGVIVEAVSALFFTQSNHARKLMTDFFLQLSSNMKMDDSKDVADKISDENLKNRTYIILALQLGGVNLNDENIRYIIDKVPSSETV